MRSFLDGVYRLSAFLSALSMVSIAVIVAVQISFRIINSVYFSLLDESLGLIFPSSAEFVGFLMVATSFLGLAYTLRKDGHIRVSILLNNVPKKLHKIFELICLILGTAFSGFIFYHASYFIYETYIFGEMSYGIVAVPLYIPQFFMIFGLLVLFVAFLDDLISFLKGRETSYQTNKSTVLDLGRAE